MRCLGNDSTGKNQQPVQGGRTDEEASDGHGRGGRDSVIEPPPAGIRHRVLGWHVLLLRERSVLLRVHRLLRRDRHGSRREEQPGLAEVPRTPPGRQQAEEKVTPMSSFRNRGSSRSFLF